MKFQRILTVVFAAVLTAGGAGAATVNLLMSADDFGVVRIDGNTVISYAGVGASSPYTTFANLSLADGWHDISIDYKNTAGDNGLLLYFTYTSNIYVGDWHWATSPFLRSLDADGNTINGLRGDYYSLAGALQQTVFGEGTIKDTYLWGGFYGSGVLFEGVFTGQMYFGPDNPPALGTIAAEPPPGDTPPADTGEAPEPPGWWLVCAALPLLWLSRRKKLLLKTAS